MKPTLSGIHHLKLPVNDLAKSSPVISGFIGDLVELSTPDGLAIRLYTDPVGGFEAVELDGERADVSSAHLAHRIMRR
ncbi:hypothetical protein [Lentzea sp.]|uniref:hypothetical protein n=1 Tax=Lentzea sp. TaxID=56099 RepID=UPI002ED24DDB